MYGGFVSTANSYDDMIDYLRVTQFGSDAFFDSGARSWTWQTCTEFGYFQTTDGGPNGIFGSVTPLSLFTNMCRDVFGQQFDSDYISKAVRSTLDYYGGAYGYKGTNVVIPNGSLDPWHALGKYTSTDPSVVWYLVKGTAHCADMYPPRAQDPPGLAVVRKLIPQNIDNWITKTPSPFATVPTEAETWTKPEVSHPLEGIASAFKPAEDVEVEVEYPEWTRYRKVHLGRPPHGLLPPPDMAELADSPTNYETGYFTQPVDHFDSQNPNTFEQRYFKNAQWAQPGGPMFLMIGGEGPESSRWVLNEKHQPITWAKKFGSDRYTFCELRYCYGESCIVFIWV
ncbi:hypothetical protein COOONC_24933 [Cooperia oncophora]